MQVPPSFERGFLQTNFFTKKILKKLVLIKETPYLCFPDYFYSFKTDTSQKLTQ